ncbi:MAG: AGE family epimerase/isomerase, partial [Cyclobacteriaceae bacterium]|nr:AGE family epimerase/isomerase [Cyclobacteriaceae bacterium HetDA_MAG_MS6]
FSDCFLVMAFAQYGIASGEDYYIQKAKQSFQRILSRQENPKGKYNKTISKNRPLKNFALPMILSNLVMELKSVLPKEEVSKVIDQCVSEIVSDFLSLDEGIIFENVLPGGKRSDSFEGRLINPGHGIEACWFLMDIGYDQGDSALIHQMKEVSLSLVKYGWDHQFGGIFYFLDAKGHPPQQLEWDQKLWWVHLEALVAMAKGYQYTGDESCMEWFEKLHEYTWSHFRDDRGGLEWYGYLNRRGEVLLPIKGGKWKGCFHVPRALFSVASTFQNMVTRSETISKA